MHGLPAEAERHAGLALEHAEQASTAWAFLAGPEAVLGRVGAAELTTARVTNLKAGVADAYLTLGLLAQQRGRLALANRHMARALRLGTRDPVLAYRVRGSIFRARKRYRKAIREFETAARLSPPSADLHRLLGACWKAAGDEDRSMEELRQVCLMDSEDAKSRVKYATWAKEKNRWADVAEVLDDINMIDPFIKEAHLLLADALRRTALNDAAKLERALGEYEVAEILEADYEAGFFFGQAACLNRLGRDPKKVLDLLEKALDDDPDHTDARELQETLAPEAPEKPEAPEGE
jgi:tetratricopeptide (TPR) repeat protein